MKRVSRLTALVLALSMVFLLAACGGGTSSSAAAPSAGGGAASQAAASTGAADGDFAGEIVFACSATLSGSMAESGVGALEGTQYAFDRKNDAGGLKLPDGNYRVKLIYEDDGGSPEVAVANTERFITQDNVKFIVSQLTSGCTLAAMELCPKYPDVYMQSARSVSSGVAEKVLSNPEGYANFFKCEYNSADLGSNIAACVDNLGDTGRIPWENMTVAFLCEDNDYGRSTIDGSKAALEALGATTVAYEVVPEGAVDFYTQLNKIKQANAEVVVCNLLPVSSGVAYAKQWKEIGLQATSFCIEFPEEPGFYDQAGAAAENILWTMMRSDFNNNERHIQFKEEFDAYYPGKEANYDQMHTNDMINVLFEAIERAGSLEASAVSAEMLKTDYDGNIGRIAFNQEDHSLISGPDYYAHNVAQIQDGKSICVWPDENALSEYRPQF